eukprot:5890996-Amphidinium_carterae.1
MGAKKYRSERGHLLLLDSSGLSLCASSRSFTILLGPLTLSLSCGVLLRFEGHASIETRTTSNQLF